jgi:hypothetical protein
VICVILIWSGKNGNKNVFFWIVILLYFLFLEIFQDPRLKFFQSRFRKIEPGLDALLTTLFFDVTNGSVRSIRCAEKKRPVHLITNIHLENIIEWSTVLSEVKLVWRLQCPLFFCVLRAHEKKPINLWYFFLIHYFLTLQ